MDQTVSSGLPEPQPNTPTDYQGLSRGHHLRLRSSVTAGPLLRPREIDDFSLGSAPNTVITRGLETALHYLRGFVCQSHPHLGRPGAVCPFTERGLAKGMIRLSPFLGEPTLKNIGAAMGDLTRSFEQIARQAGGERMFVATLLVFPEMREDEFPLIDSAQNAFKGELVKRGLMVGQFHYLCQAEGVCNPNFRPLRSPIPMLAIRHMAPGDIVFLSGSREHLEAYCARYRREEVPKQLLPRFDAAVQKFSLTLPEAN